MRVNKHIHCQAIHQAVQFLLQNHWESAKAPKFVSTTSAGFVNSEFVESIFDRIRQSIISGVKQDLESQKLELKDLSTGYNWKSLKETICAFLNTAGGVIICGIRESKTDYSLSGFNRDNEPRVRDLLTCFKNDDGQTPDLSDHIVFEFLPFLNKEVLVIFVYALPECDKYVNFDGVCFERVLTADRVISAAKLAKQREYKAEIEHAREIELVKDATINDLNIDKVNKYVNLLNREIRNETLKANLEQARPFLIKQHFLKKDAITTLGLLVCGEDPFHFLGGRSEVNCYFDTGSEISRDKKIFRNDVINLMEDSFKYIWGNIRIGRVVREGGVAQPEYPEKLVREIINNALAHRDYSIDNFVTVTIEPEKWIEIKNPGSFKEKIKLVSDDGDIMVRRLLPGIPESKNPKLASVLKVFDKIESQGRGMASLLNAALDNQVDLPFYEIKDNIITLRVPAGKLLDESTEAWLAGFEQYLVHRLRGPVSDEMKMVLAYFYKSELLNKQRYFTILLSESNNHFDVIDALRKAELIYLHPASTDEAPVYLLDRVLMITDYTTEMLQLIGNEWLQLDPVARLILNILYRNTKYNAAGLKATQLTPEVYRRHMGKRIDAKKYESLGRKVREICIKFMERGILNRSASKAYTVNMEYQPVPNLLD